MLNMVGKRGRVRRDHAKVLGTGRGGSDKGEAAMEKKECALFLLVEKFQPDLAEYLWDCGIKVAKVRTNVEDLKIDLLMSGDYTRVVVLEQGMGKFNSTNMRKELLDLAGMCLGDERELTIFKTSGVLRTDISKRTLGKAATEVVWQDYGGMRDVVNYLRSTNEEYKAPDGVEDDTKQEPKPTMSTVMRFKPGYRVDYAPGAKEALAIVAGIGGLNIHIETAKHLDDSEPEAEIPEVAVNY